MPILYFFTLAYGRFENSGLSQANLDLKQTTLLNLEGDNKILSYSELLVQCFINIKWFIYNYKIIIQMCFCIWVCNFTSYQYFPIKKPTYRCFKKPAFKQFVSNQAFLLPCPLMKHCLSSKYFTCVQFCKQALNSTTTHPMPFKK